jgi:hypothetical protein
VTGAVTTGVKPPGRLARAGLAASNKTAHTNPEKTLAIRVVEHKSNLEFIWRTVRIIIKGSSISNPGRLCRQEGVDYQHVPNWSSFVDTAHHMINRPGIPGSQLARHLKNMPFPPD